MFDRIARRYDVMNHLMTFGRDRAWRRCVVCQVGLPAGGRMLDVGAGTGAIAADAVRRGGAVSAVAADFSFEMMRAGRQTRPHHRIRWCAADALDLPFPDDTFDAVTSGYLIRNVTDPIRAFQEQCRVAKPGAPIVCLDTSPPGENLARPLVLFHLKWVIPMLGALIAGQRAAYTYLPDSTRAFQTSGQLAGTMRSAGLVEIAYRRFMFGTIAVHVGRKP
jgi:demethylmenaquinone methyltransferase/2-methoxy-6-polyprenyl-1,4-benzoquinol methylase